MTKINLLSLKTPLLLLTMVTFFSCKNLNDGFESDFDKDGCLIQKDSVVPVNQYHINLYLETSGSMFGFMPGNNKTSFQTNLWDIITSLKDIPGSQLGLYQIREKKQRLVHWESGEFRKNINSGNFQSAKSTDIPEMIDSILKKSDGKTVSMLVSDLIFSPEDGTPALMDEITPDIRTRFVSKKYASEIIQQKSDFYKRSGSIVYNSPYYFWIIGPENDVRDLMKKIRPDFHNYNEIGFGVNIGNPQYSILPFLKPVESAAPMMCSSSGLYYVFSGWDGSDSSIDIPVGINLSEVPVNDADLNYLKNNFTAESADATVSVVSVDPIGALSNQTDRKIAGNIHATHLLTLRMQHIQNDGAMVRVNLKKTFPAWVETDNLETDDNLRTKTCGLKKMIGGLGDAYQEGNLLFSQPLKILITKKNN
jgi:hypothetical protein